MAKGVTNNEEYTLILYLIETGRNTKAAVKKALAKSKYTPGKNAKLEEISDQLIQKKFAQLIKAHFIEEVEEGSQGRGKSAKYAINWKAITKYYTSKFIDEPIDKYTTKWFSKVGEDLPAWQKIFHDTSDDLKAHLIKTAFYFVFHKEDCESPVRADEWPKPHRLQGYDTERSDIIVVAETTNSIPQEKLGDDMMGTEQTVEEYVSSTATFLIETQGLSKEEAWEEARISAEREKYGYSWILTEKISIDKILRNFDSVFVRLRLPEEPESVYEAGLPVRLYNVPKARIKEWVKAYHTLIKVRKNIDFWISQEEPLHEMLKNFSIAGQGIEHLLDTNDKILFRTKGI